ncbi:hypothetical protein K525DRAFT_177624, partial [Schizophyllum commune Loenen D]
SIIDFRAVWSAPSQVITPAFERLIAARVVLRLEGFKVDVDQQKAIALSLTLEQRPTFVAYKGGQKIGEVVDANHIALQ